MASGYHVCIEFDVGRKTINGLEKTFVFRAQVVSWPINLLCVNPLRVR